MMKTRGVITKKIRFEVFKRDKFTCQYCGASAPDVVLNVDHIQPISKGGTNEIFNLITSCFSCNMGKKDRTLSDDSVVKKQKKQLDLLQDRKEQLEMLSKWSEGLAKLKEAEINILCKHWNRLARGFIVNENGKKELKKLRENFSIEELFHAMDIASRYLIWDKNVTTRENCHFAFKKIGAIANIEKQSKEDPEIKKMYYVKGILRNKFSHVKTYNDKMLTVILREAMVAIPMKILQEKAIMANDYDVLIDYIRDKINCFYGDDDE